MQRTTGDASYGATPARWMLTRAADERGFKTTTGVALALLLLLMLPAAAAGTPDRSAAPAGPLVQIWVTQARGTTLVQKLQAQPGLTFGAESNSGVSIDVTPGAVVDQQIEGFGGALTDSAAWLIAGSRQRNAIMSDLFSDAGARLSFVRVPMGSTDLARSNYTYDDLPPGQTDPGLAKFSVAHDTAYIIPLLQQARQLRPRLQLLATPWSAPGWMKIGGKLVGGSCTDSSPYLRPEYYKDQKVYENYFVKFVRAYQNTYGLPIAMVSMQNEPQNCNSSYATMKMEPEDQAAFAPKLRSALDDASLRSVRILAWDHNWAADGGPQYPLSVLENDAAKQAIDGVAYHCYGPTQPQVMAELTSKYSKPTYLTECGGVTDKPISSDNLPWEVGHILIEPIHYGARAVFYWNLALNPSSGPRVGGCATCRGLVTVNPDGSYVKNEDYYYWAQFSKFVAPGADVLGSDVAEPLKWVAFRNPAPNRKVALVVLNTSDQQQDFEVRADGAGLQTSLPPISVATYVWTPPTVDSRIGHIVQWVGDTKPQKTSWLVGPDLRRRWIANSSTYNCLHTSGAPGPDQLTAAELDQLPDLTGVWAVCGADRIGVNSILMRGQYARSNGGGFTLRLQNDGNLVLSSSAGKKLWATGRSGEYVILQADGNIVEYASSGAAVWSSNTAGSGGIWLVVRPDGNLVLFDASGKSVWATNTPVKPADYENHIVQWDGDTKSQKTSWIVKSGKRYWIPDSYSYFCWKGRGASGPDVLPAYVLDALPDQVGSTGGRCFPPISSFENHIVQWDGDTKSQKTSWIVKSGKRYWIPDPYSYYCWQDRGAPGPDVLPSYVLDALPDQVGSTGGRCIPPATDYEGHIVHWDKDPNEPKTSWIVKSGKRYWIPDSYSYYCWKDRGAPGPDDLPSYVLDTLPDQVGSPGGRCSPPLSSFENHIVQWDGDTKSQKTSWIVKDGKRYWIPDSFSYYCWQSRGSPAPDVLPSYVLDALPDQVGSSDGRCVPPTSDYEGHIVRWDDDPNGQKTSWIVKDGKRFWIPDSYSYFCWKDRGAPGPDDLPSYVLDALPDQVGSTEGRCIRPASDYEGHIVRWDDDPNAQKTSWFVRGGRRYWIPDSYSYYCWKNQGSAGPDDLPSYVLDALPDTGQWANCVPPASTFTGHIVQWDGDTNSQKTAWLVGPDGHRRWISNTSTYYCLKNRGAPGPDVLPWYVLDSLPDLNGVWAVCDAERLGVNSMLQRGFDMRSSDGRYHLELQGVDGNLVLYNQAGRVCWATNRYGADFLILQTDGNLVAYRAGGGVVWATNTVGTGAVWLYVQSDGNLVLYNASRAVWATSTAGC
jgi:glucosylceramidase